jgi:FtsH-binding integral membrane protein
LALRAALIGLLATLLAASLYSGFHLDGAIPGKGSVYFGLFLLALSLMFFASYRLSQKPAVLRTLLWISAHASFPGSPNLEAKAGQANWLDGYQVVISQVLRT